MEKHAIGKIKHGLSFHPLNGVWRGMMARCFKPTHVAFHRYGGRGITVCPRWREIQNFVEDMPPRPPGTTLHRKNNNGNYEPSNCVWATKDEQLQNRRTPITMEREIVQLYDRISLLETKLEHLEALITQDSCGFEL